MVARKSSWFFLAAGIFLTVAVLASELLSSNPGFGPYQITVIGFGLLLSLLGLNRHKGTGIGLFILLGTIVLLACAEFILTLAPEKNRAEHEDSLLGIRPAPSEDTDALGWRNESVPDDVDFVAIGDSLTWGIRANTPAQTWAGVLGELTNTVDYRMAYFGYGTNQYLALSQEALSLHPETIVIGFHFGTDIMDTLRFTYELPAYENLRLPEMSERLESSDIRESSLNEYSNESLNRLISGYVDEHTQGFFMAFVMDTHLGRLLLGDSLHERLEFEAISAISLERPDIVQLYQDGAYRTPLIVGRRLVAQDINNPRVAEGLRLTELNLEAIQNLTNEAGINLLFVSIPSKEFVYADLVAEPDETYVQMIAAETNMRSLIFAFLDEQGIAYVDTLPCLLEGAYNHQEIFTEAHDGHPSPLGYQLMAECIAQAYPD